MFKTTDYFAYTRARADRAAIGDEWIALAIDHPVAEAAQGDGRIRRWATELGRYLLVVLLSDALTVHDAFFDRRFEP